MSIKRYFSRQAVSLLLFIAVSGYALAQEPDAMSTVPSADGSPIAFGVKGEGDTTIVFVHCWTCDHQFWQPQIEHFAEKYRVVWLDLAGHGASGSVRKKYSMTAFAEDVAAVVDKIGADKVVLVGHSMGGPVSVEAAELLGDKVIAIVGVDTFYTPFESPDSEAKIEEFVGPFKEDFIGASRQMVRSMFVPDVDPELKSGIVGRFSGANPEMGISAMYGIFRWNMKKVPSILEKYSDKLRNINGAPTKTETAPHKSVTLIPGVGHFVPQVKPDEFNTALGKIISEYQ